MTFFVQEIELIVNFIIENKLDVIFFFKFSDNFYCVFLRK